MLFKICVKYPDRLPPRISNCRLRGHKHHNILKGQVSNPGEFHPEALAKPYVNVSAHTANRTLIAVDV